MKGYVARPAVARNRLEQDDLLGAECCANAAAGFDQAASDARARADAVRSRKGQMGLERTVVRGPADRDQLLVEHGGCACQLRLSLRHAEPERPRPLDRRKRSATLDRDVERVES